MTLGIFEIVRAFYELYYFSGMYIYGLIFPLIFQFVLCFVTVKIKRKWLKIAIRCVPLYIVIDIIVSLYMNNHINPLKGSYVSPDPIIWFYKLLPFHLCSILLGWLVYLLICRGYRKKHKYQVTENNESAGKSNNGKISCDG